MFRNHFYSNIPCSLYLKTADEEASQLYKFYEKTRNHPEYLILCCWRSVRELSLLMGISLVSYGLNKFDSNQIKPKEVCELIFFNDVYDKHFHFHSLYHGLTLIR